MAYRPISLSLALISGALTSPFVFANPTTIPQEPGLRLIQTSDHQRTWMTEDQVDELSRLAHEQGHCGGYMDVTEHPDQVPTYNKRFDVMDERVPTHQEQVNRLLPELSAQRLIDTVKKLSTFHNRYFKSETGVEAAGWLRDEFLRLARGRTDVTAELFTHKFAQPSVIVRIAGHGPRANERVILGGHEDSINWSASPALSRARAPGADDNASGMATLLETFRVLMDSGFRPERTVEFMAYAGEERGLLGSQDIAEQYKKDGINVVAVIQFDMTLYPGPDGKMQLIADHTDRSLTRFTAMLIDAYVKIQWSETECEYACSDHASWTQAGFASTFPFEAGKDLHNPKIHTKDDTYDRLTPSFGLHFAKLATAFAIELSSN